MKIAIVGAGYSGTALALNLYRHSKVALDIYLYDKRGAFGLGDAYSTPYPFHLLNVRAEDMSAFDDEPMHFVNWLHTHPELQDNINPERPLKDQFVPRLFYGKYLQDMLRQAQEDKKSHVNITLIPAEVKDIAVEKQQALVTSADKQTRSVDKVVLALGNNPAGAFPFPVSPNTNVIHNPWDFTAPKQIPIHDSVLIIGTGLSMIDTVLTLYHQHHKGHIFALSRHGLLPLPHAHKKIPHELETDNLTGTMTDTTRFMRHSAYMHMQAGGDWRAIVDAFRKHVTTTWTKATLSEKKKFIRHLLPYWNIHRHRVHTDIAELLNEMMQSGQLEVLAGRVLSVDHKTALIKPRHSHTTKQLPINWLINCMGPQLHLKFSSPLLQSMHEKGLASFDELQLGLAVHSDGALKINSSETSKMFYTLGALTKGTHWEITSVPDIRKQCFALAKALLK